MKILDFLFKKKDKNPVVKNVPEYLKSNFTDRTAIIDFLHSVFFDEVDSIYDNMTIIELLLSKSSHPKRIIDDIISSINIKQEIIKSTSIIQNTSNHSPESLFPLLYNRYIINSPIEFENDDIKHNFFVFVLYVLYSKVIENNDSEIASIQSTLILSNIYHKDMFKEIRDEYSCFNIDNLRIINDYACEIMTELSRIINLYIGKHTDFGSAIRKDITDFKLRYYKYEYIPFVISDRGTIIRNKRYNVVYDDFVIEIDGELHFKVLYGFNVYENYNHDYINFNDIKLSGYAITHNPYIEIASLEVLHTTGLFIHYAKEAIKIIEDYIFE